MSKKIVKNALAVIFLALAFIAVFAMSGCASEDQNPFEGMSRDDSYVIKSIKTEVIINENSTVNFVEEFTVDFLRPHLGIYRDLPINSGERYRDVKILRSEWHSVEHQDGIVRISLGLPDDAEAVTGIQTYKIGYTLVLPDRTDLKQVYLNLVGMGFTTTIEKADITLYTPFALSDQRYFYSKYGSSDLNNTVTTSAEKEGDRYKYEFSVSDLPAFNGLTMMTRFDSGSFQNYKEPFPWAETVLLIIFVGAAVIIVVKASENQEIIPITHYYPPKKKDGTEMTPSDVGLCIDSELSSEDITSMLFYWASKGYIMIEDAQSDDPTFIKIKEISAQEAGGATYLRLFDKIFSSSDNVKVSSLQYTLTSQFAALQAEAATKAKKMYEKNATYARAGGLFATVIISIITVVLSEYLKIKAFDIVFALLPWGILAFVAHFLISRMCRFKYKMKAYKPLFVTSCVAAVAVLTLAFLIVHLSEPDILTLQNAALLGFGASALVVLSGTYVRRSEEYLLTLGDVTGFKNFIEVAEKEKLEMLLEENPDYFYNVLPYAQVLGVSDKWQDKFKDITLQQPKYITGCDNTLLNVYIYGKIMRNVNSGMATAMTPKPSSSSRSGGFGGGFGGGGFGGGFGGGGFGGGGGGAR